MKSDNVLQPIRFCPYCGTSQINYFDKDVQCYAHCEHCNTIISVSRDFEEWEVKYIIQKLKAMRKTFSKFEEALNEE